VADSNLRFRQLESLIIECFERAEPAEMDGELFPYGSASRRELGIKLEEVFADWCKEEVDRIAKEEADKKEQTAQTLASHREVEEILEMFKPPDGISRTVGQLARYGLFCLERFVELRKRYSTSPTEPSR
jgi:hypothetical protein